MAKNTIKVRVRNKQDKVLLKKLPGLLALGEFILIPALIIPFSPLKAPSEDTPPPQEVAPPLMSAGMVEMAAITDTPLQVSLPLKQAMYVTVTAYSSTEDQTDGDPFRTANGSHVRDGIVAANFLPLGTQLRIPEVFGDKIFTVEDRMHDRFDRQVDIWMLTREAAKEFGIRYLKIEISKGDSPLKNHR